MPLELKFDVKADEHGVFDGRELAQELIGTAYRLLAPYVHGCPACTDTLFTVIGNRVIDQLHQHKGEALSGGFYYKGKAEEREQGERAHLEAAHDSTLELLREGNAQHNPDDHLPPS